jgi:uncharacterized protein
MSEAMFETDAFGALAGTDEELAGPRQMETTAPVKFSERVASVDVLRGFALLGILLMNITSFSLPMWDYTVPLTTSLPVFSGPHAHANTVAWFLRWVFAEGKMRGMFSMLFGAGVVLLTERAARRGAGIRAADIYTRRNMWLVVFGMAHAYFIWYGDILYWYGMTGLLFLFPFRQLKPKTLLWSAAIVFLLNGIVVGGGQTASAYFSKKQATAANLRLQQGKPISEGDIAALQSNQQLIDQWRPPQEKLDKDLDAMRKGYWSSMAHEAHDVLQTQTLYYYLAFGDVLAFMLLGMALYRNGFLTAALSYRTYAIVAIIGLGIAWSLTYYGCLQVYRSHFDQIVALRWLTLPYDIGRLGGAVGNAALLLILFKAGMFRWVMKRLANVGQMALSNYLLTSISLKFLFVWGPLKWYGRLEYYQLYEVLLGMWTVNILFSWIWLRYFQFGPMEWVWRSLTYWKRQPMLLRSSQDERPVATQQIFAG